MFLLFWALGSYLDDKAKEFAGIEQRMLLRAENARLKLALAEANDDRAEPGERGERVLTKLQQRSRDSPDGY